ncbi:MAG: HPr family phosphocarrier protein [Clostridiales bacterium]|nr:HPr family phosphocarrier protein [Clostridiales bacterium]
MVEKLVKVGITDGDRTVAKIVQLASNYKSKVMLVKGGMTANAKSIMGVMAIGVYEGEDFKIVTEGTDEASAAEAFYDYLK